MGRSLAVLIHLGLFACAGFAPDAAASEPSAPPCPVVDPRLAPAVCADIGAVTALRRLDDLMTQLGDVRGAGADTVRGLRDGLEARLLAQCLGEGPVAPAEARPMAPGECVPPRVDRLLDMARLVHEAAADQRALVDRLAGRLPIVAMDCTAAERPIDQLVCRNPALARSEAEALEANQSTARDHPTAFTGGPDEQAAHHLSTLSAIERACLLDDAGTAAILPAALVERCVADRFFDADREMARRRNPETRYDEFPVRPRPTYGRYIAVADAENGPDEPEARERALRSAASPQALLALLLHIFDLDFGTWARAGELDALIRDYARSVLERHPEPLRYGSPGTFGPYGEWDRAHAIVTRAATQDGAIDWRKGSFDPGDDRLFAFLLSLPQAERDALRIPCGMLMAREDFQAFLGDGAGSVRLFDVDCQGSRSWPPRFGHYEPGVRGLGSPGWAGRLAAVNVWRESILAELNQEREIKFALERSQEMSTELPGWEDRRPLDVWGLFSAWNWRKASATQDAHAKEVALVERYLRDSVGLAEDDAGRVARFINKDDDSLRLPLPKRDIRYLILTGAGLPEIAAAFPTRLKNDFDDPTFAAIRAAGYGNPVPGMADDVTTRWSDFVNLLGTPEPPLLVAVVRPEVLAWMLDQGEAADITNAFAKTALMTAAHLNVAESVRLLLARGADPNAVTDPPIDDTPYGGKQITHGDRTALMYAAENASAEIIDLLLARGADPCLTDSQGWGPLDYFLAAPSKSANMVIASQEERRRVAMSLRCPVP